jgi:pyruvate/2-oxoglutarate dehydrogenase complex dihydrolipoamide acyltransferase (E2) component
MVEADVSAALELIAAQEAAFARLGLEASLITVVAQAAAELLPHYPMLNAVYSDSGIIRRRSVHLAVGMGTADGLRWACITHAGDLTLRGVARALRNAPPEGDCTFALLSLPASNGYSAPPPLPGTGALLAVGMPTQRAVVLPGDRIAVRPVATLTLSYDARLATYAEAGCFLRALREAVERESDRAIKR